MKRLSWIIALVGLLACGLASSAWAQATAQVSGTVKDQSGAVLPGVEVTATQTATGIKRTVLTNETGSYVLSNLPLGPYRLEAALQGFRSFVQTGIVLQVDSNPVINISLEIGQVSEQVEVQADAALVETRSTGIGQVIDNVRVLELPLNGRQVTDLIILSGAAVGGGDQGTARTWPTDFISVGGGLNDGLTYLLDGGTHNDPFSNANLPLPFPDALQEFKVETSAMPAQYGQHSSGAVNSVTKSGTNQIHGDLFEFVRNKIFNARNAFATERDGLKRNQFGGVIGGPIIKNKLFFFGGHQTTLQRSEANIVVSYVPTPRMLAGDWTAVTAPACNNGRQINLSNPFLNNRIDPAVFSKAALTLVTKYLPKETIDECGQTVYGRRQNSDEQMTVGKIDYQMSDRQSLFGRYERGSLFTPNNYNGQNILSLSIPDYTRRFHSFVLGHTYSLSPQTISAFRGTVLRTLNDKSLIQDFYNYSDLGIKNLYYPEGWKHFVRLNVSGAFTQDVSAPGVTNSTVEQFTEDITTLHGAHQIGFGANYIHSNMNYTSGTWTAGRFQFNGNATGQPGLSLADLMIGRPNEWRQDQIAAQYLRQNYNGLYLQNTWKATPKFTVNGGIRWEPYFWPYDHRAASAQYNKAWFDQGLRSTVYANAPAGILFPGEPGAANIGTSEHEPAWLHFAPRAGLAWDPKGNGMTVVRAAYGIFNDYPHFQGIGGIRNTPPRGGLIQLTNPSGGFDDPWQSYPGGNPLPFAISKDVAFPLGGTYTVIPQDAKTSYVNQWNFSLQKQIGMNWLVAGNYLGNSVVHQMYEHEANPAVFVPGVGDANRNCFLNGVRLPFTVNPGAACSTTSNTQQRRVLSLQNPAQGQYFSNIVEADTGGTRSYNALILSVQRRRARGITIQGNYTYSHCIDTGYTDIIQTNGVMVPERRGDNRGNCELDRRHNLNMSTVYETPQFANAFMKVVVGGWRVSGIVRALSGPMFSINTGIDRALTGTVFTATNPQSDQRPNQVLPSPYMPNKSIANGWLNPAAFVQPALGTYGTMGRSNIVGPGSIRIDMGLVRIFHVGERQSLEFRAEAFNVANHVNACSSLSGQQGAPACMSTNLSDATFGRILAAADPRIMQMALKFVF